MAVPKLQSMMQELDLSHAEREFVEAAETHVTHEANAARVLADVYLAHHLRGIADDLIDSNKKLADASNRYARGLNWLTGALVVAVIIQAGVMFFSG